MAKKKKADAPSLESLIGQAMQVVKREEVSKENGGVEFHSFAERWLWDSNVLRVGEICQLAGIPASGKSQYLSRLAAMFVRAGGAAEIIDTEHKSNAAASIIPNVGDDVFFSGRFGLSAAGSMDAIAQAKKGDKEAEVELMSAWMEMVKERIDSIKEHKQLREIPIMIGVDSLLGSTSAEGKEKFEKAKGSVGGRDMLGAARASAFTEWFPNIAEMLQGTNIALVFTNHTKEKLDTNAPAYLGKQKTYPGGEAPKFRSSTILDMSRGAPVRKGGVGGRAVWINVAKNSFGDDQRKLEVTFYYDIKRDGNGQVVRDEDGNPIRTLKWDWDEATANLLRRYCISGAKESTAAARAALPGLKFSQGRVECSKLDVPKLSMTEFGRLIMTREDLYQRVMEITRLTIHHAPADRIFVPDWSGIDDNTEDGSWEKDPYADKEEEEEA